MANRVLLDSEGLQISRPGVNVLTAGLAGLQFTSIATHTPRFIQSSVSRSSGGNATFSFGKTFPGLPLVTWNMQYTYGGSNQFMCGVGPTIVGQEEGGGFYVEQWRLTITPSNLTFRTEAAQSGTLYFKVWDFA